MAKLIQQTTIVFFLIFLVSCKHHPDAIKRQGDVLFTSIPASYSNIDFINKLKYDKDFNIYTYRNFYNGGGVALGDINNDGLIDILFTGNMMPTKLYLNKGNFKFEDITEKAGIDTKDRWSTGACMADVNGDGYLDIYICNSGLKDGKKKNQFYLNNKNGTFNECAEKLGIADKGNSTQAVFFDYDHDGDLDLFVLNNSFRSISSFNLQNNERGVRDKIMGSKLYRNDNGKFTDVSDQAGIYGSKISFGLGVTIADVNKDGWPDIYVSNDFFERDYLYINDRHGGFKEQLPQQINSISMASMGSDIADLNNDGFPEIFATEMLPEDEARIKTMSSFENWDKYQFNLKNGYWKQFSRNTLQLNNGNNTYSEIGRYAGVQSTDWSWGALISDFDNDGFKDIFISNGISKDLTNQDYIQYVSGQEFAKTVISGNNVDYSKLIDIIPSTPIPNYIYRNQGNMTFKNMAAVWGLATPGFSNGSAYADLDNDGDMDLVVNNVNMPPFIYRNESVQTHPDNKFLKVTLVGKGMNTGAFGTKVTLYYNKTLSYQEEMPTRGFQSTSDSRLNFGLGHAKIIDSLVAIWADSTKTILRNIKPNQRLTLKQSDAVAVHTKVVVPQPTILKMAADQKKIDFKHKENDFSDFDQQRLIYHMLSADGPRMARGDVNKDGLDDFYICGAKDQPGALYVQNKNGSFTKSNLALFEKDKGSEDTDCLFFDADNDGDLDLFVCSGGSEFSPNSTSLISRLYINDGKGKFTKSPQVLPSPLVFESASCVTAADYDGDGFLDLFVGVRSKPLAYGEPVNGYILHNDGNGHFTDVTATVAPELINIGMITDAKWFDYDKDGKPDLVVVGDYMPVTVFHNTGSKLTEVTQQVGLAKTNGWWNRIIVADVNKDGYPDLIAGNLGLNSRFKASVEKPVTAYINDFNQNGTVQQIICCYNVLKSYPMVLRHDLVAQIPFLKKKYLKYEDYKGQTITDIFTKQQLEGAVKLTACNMASSVFINSKNGTFTGHALPAEAQYSPVCGILADDFDDDGNIDLLIGGNFSREKPETGIYDASYGLLLKGDGKGGFTSVKSQQSGVCIKGEIRDIIKLNQPAKKEIYVVARNNDSTLIYQKIKVKNPLKTRKAK